MRVRIFTTATKMMIVTFPEPHHSGTWILRACGCSRASASLMISMPRARAPSAAYCIWGRLCTRRKKTEQNGVLLSRGMG